jgi:hypothetical protein
VFVGNGYSTVVALLFLLTWEILLSQVFFAGEWWGTRSLRLSFLIALAPSLLLTIFAMFLVNWIADLYHSGRAISQQDADGSLLPRSRMRGPPSRFTPRQVPDKRTNPRNGQTQRFSISLRMAYPTNGLRRSWGSV